MPADWKPDVAGAASRVAAINVAGAPAVCLTASTTMQCLRELYKTADYKPQAPGKQFIGISGFLEQYPNAQDLQQFLATERTDAVGYMYNFTSIDGGLNDQSMPGVEANLDVQTIAAQAYPIPSTFYSVAGRPPFNADSFTPTNTNEPYASEFEYLLSQRNVPSVVSTSVRSVQAHAARSRSHRPPQYGDDEQTVPTPYAQRVCGEIAALGAR